MNYLDKSAFPDVVANLITEDVNVVLSEAERDYFASVAVVRHRDKWLLGLAKNTGDDRNNKWCCPGGGVKNNESPEAAAVREAKEETGVSCRAISGPLEGRFGKSGVAFIACRSDSADRARLKPNAEFSHLGWYTIKEMKALDLYHNVEKLVKAAKKHN